MNGNKTEEKQVHSSYIGRVGYYNAVVVASEIMINVLHAITCVAKKS